MLESEHEPEMRDYDEFGTGNSPIHGWRRVDRTNSHAILFVHGFWGSASKTWRLNDGCQSFQELIMNDELLRDYDIAEFNYETSLLNKLRIDRIARQLENELGSLDRAYDWVVVAHSLGGLICMRYVIDRLKAGNPASVSGLIFYGTPIKGVEMLRIADLAFPLASLSIPILGTIVSAIGRCVITIGRWVTGNLVSMAPSVQLLQDLQHDWTGRVCNGGDDRFPSNGRTSFLIRVVTGNEDWVVTEDSARGVLGDRDWFPIDRGHIAMVKPENAADPCYRHARSFFVQCQSSHSPRIRSKLHEVSDWVSGHLGKRVVRNWNYELEISQQEAKDWWCPIRVKQCRYTLRLPETPWSFGLGLGREAIGTAWAEHNPIHIHGIRTGTAPMAKREAIRKSIEQEMRFPERAWEFFFPSSEIRIRENAESPWIELSRQGPRAIRDGLLLAEFHLPGNERRLIGREVDVELRFVSIQPVDLQEYTVHFKWLTDKAKLSVTVKGRLQWMLVTPFPMGPTNFQMPEHDDDPTIFKQQIATEDIVMPDTYVSIRWLNVSS